MPPDLAWHTAVVLKKHNCMLIYGGAVISEKAKGKYECKTVNWDTFGYYFKENKWTRMPRQKTTPGEIIPLHSHEQIGKVFCTGSQLISLTAEVAAPLLSALLHSDLPAKQAKSAFNPREPSVNSVTSLKTDGQDHSKTQKTSIPYETNVWILLHDIR